MATSNLSTPAVRDECLNINIFWSLAMPASSSATGSSEYNHQRRFLGLADLLCDVA